jgi:uncharacterized protein
MGLFIQFVLGLLFGAGLIVSGLSDPQNVFNFLDFAAIETGGWDPRLIFVLASAAFTTFLGYRLVLKRNQPLFDTVFHLPAKKNIDAPIIVGPAIFGIGWGLSGFCPGPAFVALGTGSMHAALFVVAMIVGMIGARMLALRQIKRSLAPA